MLKLFLFLYADDITLIANDKENLQLSLNILESYCKRWKLKVNTQKTKVTEDYGITYRSILTEQSLKLLINMFYLCVTFTSGGSLHETQNCLAGKTLTAIFKMNKNLYQFTDISIKHRLYLFDKLIVPIFCYEADDWEFI